jgi:hypothetical protein
MAAQKTRKPVGGSNVRANGMGTAPPLMGQVLAECGGKHGDGLQV